MVLNKEELETRAIKHLTRTIKQKIRNHKLTYDYCKWNREWQTSAATTKSILKFMFGLKDNQVEEINHLRISFVSVISRFLLSIRKDKTLMLKFFRFYMSLPVFEYEFKSKYHDRMEDIPPFKGSETSNTFMLNMCNFSFKNSYKKIKESELKEGMNQICDNGEIYYSYLTEIAVRLSKEFDEIEQNPELYYISKSQKALFEPLLSLIENSLNKTIEVNFEKVKDPTSTEKDPSTSKVDLALYLAKKGGVYTCIEFKQFPIAPQYFGPNGKFNPEDLFEECEEDQSKPKKEKPLALNKFLKQIICEMLSHKCDKGILTDSYTFIFLEIDLERSVTIMNEFSGEKAKFDESREVPINYTIKNCHTPNVTLRQTLLDFFNKSIVNENTLRLKEKQMANLTEFYRLSHEEFLKSTEAKRNKEKTKSKLSESHGTNAEGTYEHRIMDDSSIESSSIFSDAPYSNGSDEPNDLIDNSKPEKEITTKDLIVPKNEIEILKHGHDRFSQVYSIDARYFTEFLKDEIRGTDRVVIKIHDPWYYPNDGIIYNDTESKNELDLEVRKNIACEENYKFERICYKILGKDPKFNSIALDHDHLKLSFCGGGCLSSGMSFFRQGMTNIFKYIETQELPYDQATYEKALEQLEIIHKNGIIHSDISERNVLYSKVGKVYIIDYSLSCFSTNNSRVMKDINDLKSIFF